MSKRAEQRASEAYPGNITVINDDGTRATFDDSIFNEQHRRTFIQGYEQAEKDFAELIQERIKTYEGIYEENKAYGGDTESNAEVLKELKALLKEVGK